MFECEKCNRQFKRKCDLSRHIKKCNGKRYCLNCGKETINPKYCNNKCAASHTNLGRFHSEETKNKISNSLGGLGENRNKKYSNCLNCGKDLKPKRKYCNVKCQSEKRYKDNISDWFKKPDEYTAPRYFMKVWLIKKYNNKCSRCGWSEKHPVTGNTPLEMHHKDGNWKNNHPNNIDLVCPNCHSLTETYRIGNRGKGRKIQREYYRGKHK